MDRARLPGLVPGQRHPDWHQVYEASIESQLPWFFPELDPDLRKELEREKKPERRIVLDIGCGLGNQTALIGQYGFKVTGIDISVPAVLRARSLHPDPTFLSGDILESTLLETFDFIVDRGCFHVLDPRSYPLYLNSILRLLKPRGRLLLKVLSIEQGDCDFGPIRFSMARLHEIYSARFEILKFRRTIYHGSTPHPPKAWFAVMRIKKEKDNE